MKRLLKIALILVLLSAAALAVAPMGGACTGPTGGATGPALPCDQ